METYTIKRYCENCGQFPEIEIPKGQIAKDWKCACPNCGVPTGHKEVAIYEPPAA